MLLTELIAKADYMLYLAGGSLDSGKRYVFQMLENGKTHEQILEAIERATNNFLTTP